MDIKPLHDRVIVKKKDPDSKTASGIIIPDSVKEKPQEGTVIAAGPGVRNEEGTLIPLTIKKDDHILFDKYAGVEIRIDGEDYLMMKEEAIFGIVG